MNIVDTLSQAAKIDASDVFLIAGLPLSVRRFGKLEQIGDAKMTPETLNVLIQEIYELADHRPIDKLKETGDDDFSFALRGLSRFRVSAFKQRGSLAAVIRIIPFELPHFEELGIPQNIIDVANSSSGMTLITGPAGSGKSTTLACIIDQINRTQQKHIITLEDPLEYLHRHNKSIVTQREINLDTESYVSALRAALRQSPDVILLGELRDFETISVAMTAAETGHHLLSTLHTIGAANTIDRIIDVFPASQQRQIAVQLSMVLNSVITQILVPSVDGSVVPVFEIMKVNPAIRNMIRDHKIPQIEGLVYSSNTEDIRSMDANLLELYKEGRITGETALNYASNPEMLKKKL